MADITVTAANVVPDAGYKSLKLTAGGTVTRGNPVYQDSGASYKVKRADANASQATAQVMGIALNDAGDGQPVEVMTEGVLAFGAAVIAAGLLYVVSATAGGIAPSADLTTGWYTGLVGYALDTSKLQLMIRPTGVVVA